MKRHLPAADGDVGRRRFGALVGGMLTSMAMGGACRLESLAGEVNDGTLKARPKSSAKTTAEGLRALGLDKFRDAMLQVPSKPSSQPLPLVVMFHGAGGNAERFARRFASVADDMGAAVVTPASRESTWDAIRGGFGPDVTFLDAVLERVFEIVAVDGARIAAGGFSDGATYALSLGLVNGDLFSRVVAFSPGFIVDGAQHGRPRVFISHGTADPILPIDRCSRVIVPTLRKRGFEVTYREFEGGHEVPAEVASEGLSWATRS